MIEYNFPQGSESWHAARAGIPTASEFSRLVTSKGAPSSSMEGYARELAAELFAGKAMGSFEGNMWSDRGKEHEQAARDLYEFTFDTPIRQVGFITNDAGTAGCSPDGLIGEDGGLELKCLKAERHVEAVHYIEKHGKPPTSYVLQVQGCLWLSERRWWNLCFYHPDLPLKCVRVEPDLGIRVALIKGVSDVIQARDKMLASLRQQQTEGTPA